MDDVIRFLFGQYSGYQTTDIVLEITAVVTSIISVFFSKKNNILVFPFGIVSTAIFVYLLYKWGLIGDLIINAYYFIMSLIGWFIWSSKNEEDQQTPVTYTTAREWLFFSMIFCLSCIMVFFIYLQFDRLKNWLNYVDIITTGIFFVGMWAMALRKLEHWLVLLAGNLISVPLYFIKGYTFSSFLYLFLSIIAVIGYIEWKKYHLKQSFPEKELL